MQHPEKDRRVQAHLEAYSAAVRPRLNATDWKARLSQWSVYAAAAGSALALATSADAGIIYHSFGATPLTVGPMTTGTHRIVHGTNRATRTFTMGGDKLTANLFFAATTRFGPRGDAGLGATTAIATKVGFAGHSGALSRFSPTSSSIMSGFSRGGTHLRGKFRNGLHGPFVTTGNFLDGVPGFAAVSLSNGDLGWIRLSWDDSIHEDGYPDEIKIYDWAYNDVPGAPIQAGEGAAPEPGTASMFLLAAGAVGVLALRRRRAGVRPQA